MFKKAMNYLGLGDDDEYEDYEPTPEPARRAGPAGPPPGAERRPPREPNRPPAARPPAAGPGPSRERPREDTGDVVLRGSGTVRPLGPDPRASETGVGAVTSRSGAGQPGGRGAVVRPIPIPATAKPVVCVPTSFTAAQEIADSFKGKAPVIMNLQELDRDLSRRLIDFASGLCYGLGGTMDRVANSVFLLTPADVEVSAEDKRRLEERGYS